MRRRGAGTLRPAALVVINQTLRSDAAETVAYFLDQNVQMKVISGDNAVTVGAIAAQAGIPGADHPVDARDLPDDQEALAEVLENASVFGRVTPAQKRAMVGALQSRGHTVAMTGDGVNDVLALKDADLGIAMGSGAGATRSVAQIVLLDDRFAVMPSVVAEGRRVLGNVERVSDLFLTKSFYAMVVSIATVVFVLPFPFLNRHLTVVTALTIGIPAFFLALMPNKQRFRPGFFRRVREVRAARRRHHGAVGLRHLRLRHPDHRRRRGRPLRRGRDSVRDRLVGSHPGRPAAERTPHPHRGRDARRLPGHPLHPAAVVRCSSCRGSPTRTGSWRSASASSGRR